jgi:hypothetical protein
VDAPTAVSRDREAFLRTRNPRVGGGLLARTAARDLTLDTPLRRRAGIPCVSRLHGDRLDLLLGDRSLDVPAWIEPAVVELRPGRVLTPRELPLTAVSAVVLCRRLLREGLLEPA